MIVLITNVTDAPGGKLQPRQVDIYNKTLGPGEATRIPAELVDKRVRLLEKEGLIAIGALPSWYKAAKARTGKRLTDEQKRKLTVRPKPPEKVEKPKKEKILSLPKAEEIPVTEQVPEAPQDVLKEFNRKR